MGIIRCILIGILGVYLNIEQKSKMEFGKIFCDLHPHEVIANFCCKEECFVGLCATCICNHTEMHVQNKTTPQYENIRTTYSRLQDALRTRIHTFDTHKKRINAVLDIILLKRRQLQETIDNARAESIHCVNAFWDEREKDFIRRMDAEEKKIGLHNETRMDNLMNLVSRDTNNLFVVAQDLTSQNFLESFQRLRSQVLVNADNLLLQIQKEIQRNQNYETNITVHPNYLNQIREALDKAITVVFCEQQKKLITHQRIPTEKSRLEIRGNLRHSENNYNTRSSITIASRKQIQTPKQFSRQPVQKNEARQIEETNTKKNALQHNTSVPAFNHSLNNPSSQQIFYNPSSIPAQFLQNSPHISKQGVRPREYHSAFTNAQSTVFPYETYVNNNNNNLTNSNHVHHFHPNGNLPNNFIHQNSNFLNNHNNQTTTTLPNYNNQSNFNTILPNNYNHLNQSTPIYPVFQMRARQSQVQKNQQETANRAIRGSSLEVMRNQNTVPLTINHFYQEQGKSEIKKVKKGGLTVLKNAENRQKNQN